MIEKKVFIFNAYKQRLSGIISFPDKLDNTKKYPTVVLVHGFRANKREGGMFDELAEYLTRESFIVVRFDFSGRGESEGDYNKNCLSILKDELNKVLEYVKSHPNVDISKIGLLGQSFGTSVIVSLMPDVKCLVLMGAISHPKEILEKLVRKDGSFQSIEELFWKDFDNYNLVECIKNIHCPILFVHGERDDKVPISEMESYFENANFPKEKVIIEGADHGLRPHRKKMYLIVVEWFKKYLLF